MATLVEGTSVLRSEGGTRIKSGRRALKFAQVNFGLVYLNGIELSMALLLVAFFPRASVYVTVMDFIR